ncbi:Oplophorus-luciferin 2-monooxygenase non-catalytic subunit-like 15 [Homarus americanus]|uniref:Oplophorus-luciferin 2-monooxygenase non-catalytic subunit-like 15 n=1 Tax=Homarus americanus TaxID=6706 RepID=A0A8J5JT34_HOMAM|nr:Oplophorus-luciferin 2-monooxygenase non-catalytic subunit-like 15 [Homarus americanus]
MVLAVLAGAWAECPSGGAISPCTCKEVMPGRTMECSAITSSSQLQKVFSTDMPSPDFQFFQIVKLSGRCSLEKIPANVFGNEDTMLELTFADANKMTSYPFESLGDMHALYKFFLSNTQIDTITHFGPAPNLTMVSVTGSQVTTIESGAFEDLGRLTRLDLHDNPLTSIEDGWFSSSTSESWDIYLDGCDISEISPGAFSGTLPSGVFLQNNKFTSIPEATFRPLVENMEKRAEAGELSHYVDLEGNPLVCDCDIKWIATSETLLPFVRNAVCTNGDVDGTNIADLPADFFASC